MQASDPVRIVRWDEVLKLFVDVSDSHPLPVSGGGAADVPVVTVPGDTASLDAFGRQRVSTQGFRVDSTFTYDKQPILFDEVIAGTGTAAHDANLRAVYLSTGGTANLASAQLRLQTYTPYTPGNSQQVILTGNMNPDDEADWTNAIAEIAYGDEDNGIGFCYDENGAHVFLRTSISGSPVVDLVDQADWNGNQLLDTDWSKSQIFIVDFQSLAVGRIRFYLDRNGIAILVHEIHNDNLRVGPYWQLASLPPYWKVSNTGVANETCRVLAICVTVKAEGAPDLDHIPGYPFTATRGIALKTVSTTLVPVLSIRLLAAFKGIDNRALVIPQGMQLTATENIHWVVVKNPTLTGASWGAVHAESLCQYDVAATALSGGRNILSGYAGAGKKEAVSSETGIAGKGELSRNADGDSDVLTIAAIRVDASDSDVGASINFKEIR